MTAAVPDGMVGDAEQRPSPQSAAAVAELWQRPHNDELSLEEWRFGAGFRERLPRDPALRGAAVDAGGVDAEWAWLEGRPDVGVASADGPVVLVFHGGGFVVCSIGTHRLQAAHVATAAGGRALVVGYRLAPEHPFPAAVEDCAAAYRWVLESGVAPERVAFWGDSAGGNLVLSTALLARRQGLPMPGALVAISPAPDLTFSAASYVTNRATDPFSRIDNRPRMLAAYLAGADPLDPLASPLFADLSDLPPLLVLVGPDETHVDCSLSLAERARAQGVDAVCEIVPGAFHTWMGYVDVVPEADEAVERCGRFIAAHTAAG